MSAICSYTKCFDTYNYNVCTCICAHALMHMHDNAADYELPYTRYFSRVLYFVDDLSGRIFAFKIFADGLP